MFTYKLDEEIELRPLEPSHARPIYQLIDQSRSSLRQWLAWVDATNSVAASEEYVRSSMTQAMENGAFNAGIWYKGQLAGIIGFHEINWNHRSVGIGYWLGSHYEGKGLVTSALRVLIDYALIELNLHRVEIRCATGNHRSRAVPQRLGFILEGIIREAELLPIGYVDHAVYGMLQQEWKLKR
ncbi:GNAT family protein [Paenibacillus sp. PsM32]|uniref:GNAT family protein n=1 Tax=Paenibacillus kyungheensis TaxID=1452732 RepID=A0AAX3M1M8_9BACL|nr:MULTISPECIES: GNAT family protein [Paenibacillus]MDN4620299.1 GNAT family protein [Paenibacillus sp. PsM32]MDQ1235960.1 ribosomal-protein-serine acetyltransferase [Paenibacillus sp. SORGH_AS_0306]MDR6113009.1 ribosomal-protein-serine acetyltransferase [Paenibacillus sp. SORGH_AS_0338]WCT55446.1 GNAT family protein [Paenibacillus kyungheensis]WDF51400.1 GNAT family protein [Paenibacillus sp. KACC 21273]